MCRSAGFRLLFEIEARVGCRQCLHLRIGNSDEHDRFGVFNQLDALEHRVTADSSQYMDRLAGIAGRADKIGCDEGPANRLASLQDRRNGNVCAWWSVGVQHLGIIPETFRRMGVNLKIKGDDILVNQMDICEIESFIDGSILTVSDHPWPGFTPDLLSIILVLATQCKGSVLIHQKMFESRLFFVDKLIDMGAQVILCDPHRATVIGLNRKQSLRGIEMTSPDIRAGVSLLIAALSADGESIIHNIQQIDRGYENIEGRLRALGASIERTVFDK